MIIVRRQLEDLIQKEVNMANSIQITGISEEEKNVYIEKLAEDLPVLRIKLGVSQEELAAMIGLTRQTYSTLETKKRKMTWSVFLSLIFIFDNSEQTHDFIRKNGLFPEKMFEESNIENSIPEMMTAQFISPRLRDQLDDQAIHAIETMIMVEYARCNNLPGHSVVKAFNGKSFGDISEKDILIQNTLNELKK